MAQYSGVVKWFNNAKGFGFLGRTTARMYSATTRLYNMTDTRA